MTVHNFQEAHQALSRFYNKRATSPYTLDRMHDLMDILGNPQETFKAVHIAGTSGKSSTAYYAAALLQAGGATVGLTVSPHVDEVNERLQVNLKPLPETEFCKQLTDFLQIVDASGLEPSYFECMIAFAYWYFARRGVDYAVIEVGLGGLLDGTNVISREDKVCIITDIGLDHTEVLGDTLPQIARQKAGIIHAGNQVFMYDQGPEVVEVVQEVCERMGANLQLLELKPQPIQNTMPPFQQRNFSLAEKAVSYVLDRDNRPNLNEAQLIHAAKTVVPARMESLTQNNKTVIIDGSHNAQKLATLAESIKTLYPGQSVGALTAFVVGNDERWQGGIDVLIGFVEQLIITTFQSEQDVPKVSVEPEKIAAYCKLKGFENVEIIKQPEKAYQALLASPEQLLLVAGSFYLLNHIRPLIVKA